MCSPSNQQLIDTIVSDWVGETRPFTAFEVSLEAKKRGADERHRDMKGYIHQSLQREVDFGNYVRTLVPVGNEQGQQLEAYLYHPDGYDVSLYQPLNRNYRTPQQVGSSIPALTHQTSATSVADDEEDDLSVDNTYELGVNDTLLVRKQYLESIGLEPGDTIYVYSDNLGELALSKNDPSLPTSRQQIVHTRGYVRLSKQRLQEFGLYGQKFEVAQDFNKVIVKGA